MYSVHEVNKFQLFGEALVLQFVKVIFEGGKRYLTMPHTKSDYITKPRIFVVVLKSMNILSGWMQII